MSAARETNLNTRADALSAALRPPLPQTRVRLALLAVVAIAFAALPLGLKS